MAGIMFEKEATVISEAIKNNDLVGLRTALSEGQNPHRKDRKGNTYLHYVCTMHRPFIIHALINADIDMNAQNRHGNTALHVTALQHECGHVGDLLAAGIDPTIKNKAGKTAAEIPTKSKFWKSIYEKYQPGIFEAVTSHEVDKVLYLLHCWSRVDARRNGLTLRQFAASHKFHDIVFYLDVHRYTLGAIYSILEGDVRKAESYILNPKCDINFLNQATGCSHILQHALRLQDIQLIDLFCKSQVDVNIRVTINGFLKAPLFFAAIDPKLEEEIFWAVLKAGADFSLRDERGRNAALFALDKTKGKVPVEVIDYMCKHGLDISQRDGTGLTLRDVARFSRRQDIVALVDKIVVHNIRQSNITELERLAAMGYDGILIDFNHRDTSIYASGNETDAVVQFIQMLPEFQRQVHAFHTAVQHFSLDKIQNIIDGAHRPDMLINSRDKGGRTALHLSILYWRTDVLQMLLSQPHIDLNAVDNLGRTAYHYACALEEVDERNRICQLLENANVNTETLDYMNHKASYNLTKKVAAEKLFKERKIIYGMEKQLACVDKYEDLCRLLKRKNKQLKHFEKAVCKFKFPVSQFPTILCPLMPDYRDLVFVAMDAGKEDIAVRLIQTGSDWRQKEIVSMKNHSRSKEKVEVLMTTLEYAQHLKMNKVIAAIEHKTRFLSKIREAKDTTNITDKTVQVTQSGNIVNICSIEQNERFIQVCQDEHNQFDDPFEGGIVEDIFMDNSNVENEDNCVNLNKENHTRSECSIQL